jgi:hypothetical protein
MSTRRGLTGVRVGNPGSDIITSISYALSKQGKEKPQVRQRKELKYCYSAYVVLVILF